MLDLIVREPFGAYARGSRITEPAKVKAILDGPQRSHVIAVAAQDREQEPKVAAAPTPTVPPKA